MPDILIPYDVIDGFREPGHGIATEYHVTNDICAVFKPRDLIVTKLTLPDPNYSKRKKVVSWRKKTSEEINKILADQEWRC